jgi:hypothetical protein
MACNCTADRAAAHQQTDDRQIEVTARDTELLHWLYIFRSISNGPEGRDVCMHSRNVALLIVLLKSPKRYSA